MKIVEEFKQFALRGNVIDMAVGFTVGAAFTTIVKSLVDDIVMPIIGLAVGKVDFSNLFFLLKPGEKVPPPYSTLAEAHAGGAVTCNYGLFINNVFTFTLVAMAMFFLIRMITHIEKQLDGRLGEKQKDDTPANKKCPFCHSTIAYLATRCPQCTSQLEEAKA